LATLETLRARAIRHLKQAFAAIEPLDPELDGWGRSGALKTMESTIALLESISLDSYRELRKAGASTALFDNALASAKDKTGNQNSYTSIPYELKRVLGEVATNPNPATVRAIRTAKAHVSRARRDLGLMTNSTLRILQSNWLIIAIFFIAIAYALVYFVFVGANVEKPLTGDGARQVAASAKTNWDELKQIIVGANGVADAAKDFISKITNLVSTIPPLLSALAALWLVVRSQVARRNTGLPFGIAR
jgi:hypothetical protein